MGGALDKLTNADREKTIFVRGDKVVDYGRLMEVMDALRGAGYLKIGLVGLETVGTK
ncbi:Biopolymer transport protein ExbD [compost metagenome]